MIRKTVALPLLVISIVLLVAAPLGVLLPTWANQPAPAAALSYPMHPAVANAWRSTDGQILAGSTQRAWLWGPNAIAMSTEYYSGSPTGVRQMIYFDKGRMDVFDPSAPADSDWFVVGGSLVSEMISGNVQFGDQQMVQRGPAVIPVAGDLDQVNPVTYATFARLNAQLAAGNAAGTDMLLAASAAPTVPAKVGSIVNTVLRPDGSLFSSGAANAQVLIGTYDDSTGHNIAAPFAAWDAAQPFPATWLLGHPISEPYWIDTLVLGTSKRVLVQAFERRVLTYTPDNPAAWQVESTNAGTHYRQWRGLSQPANQSLTGLASMEPSGEEVVAAATANGVDPYLMAAIVRVVSGGDPLAGAANGGFGLLGVQPLQGGSFREDPFANASAAAQQLAAIAGDARTQLAAFYQPSNPDLSDPALATLVDQTLATAQRLRETYAPSSASQEAAEPTQATGAAYQWSAAFDQHWWEQSLGWFGSWGGAVPGWQVDPLGYYCVHPAYAPGSKLRLIANGVTLDCTVGARVPDAALVGWGDSWVVELNDAAFTALHLDTNNAVTVAEPGAVDTMRNINFTDTPGVQIGSGMAAYYSPSYDRAWWEWAMTYYNDKGVITPGWSLDPNGMYCVHPNYLPGDRLRLVANGITIDCTVGDMVADQDVYNWRQRFAVELGWDTFTALGLQQRNWVDVYYLGPSAKPERLGEPPTETPTTPPTTPSQPVQTPTPEPTAEPTATAPAEATPDTTPEPTEVTATEPTEEPTAVPTDVATEEPAPPAEPTQEATPEE